MLTGIKVSMIGGLIVMIGATIFAAQSIREAARLKQEIRTLQQVQSPAGTDEVQKLVEEVGDLIVLPEGQPTVATITDRGKLNDVPFFTKAENGDKVLIYVDARKAFLYRVDEKKIVEVASLNLDTAQQSLAANIILRNGTVVVGLTKRFEDQIKQVFPGVEVIDRDNAQAPTYTETLVVDLTGEKRGDAQRLATAVSGTVATLPAGELRPTSADFLIIIGSQVVPVAPTTTSTPASGN